MIRRSPDPFEDARCRDAGIDPEMFWDTARENAAKLLCNGTKNNPCPVRDRCLREALDISRQHETVTVGGVWGGTNVWQRNRLVPLTGGAA